MTPDDLARSIFDLTKNYASTHSFSSPFESVDEVIVERPKSQDFGDWSSNVALKLSKKWGVEPRFLAAELQEYFQEISGVEKVEVAGPGFINFFLDPTASGAIVEDILSSQGKFGHSFEYSGITFNLEFVSANPTGPIHLGGTRWAAAGDSLARILQSQGAEVTKEYYFNDHGAQIDRFARSLLAAYRKQDPPEDGYGGEYIREIAERITVAYQHNIDELSEADAQELFRSMGVELMFGDIKQSLKDFGVVFDVYFHEDSLFENRAVEKALEKLTSLGHVYEKDGAKWLKTTNFGDDKDRVIIKSDGNAAYLAGDLAYYLDKRERGFDRNIIMLGADHHGYVARMMAMCAAFGDEPGVNLEIMIGQMVNLVRNGTPVRMSKRAGTVVTLEDFVEAVGVDAARYSLVRSSSDSPLDIDLDLLSKKSNDNPVFYVQYAHARTCSVLKNAQSSGVMLSGGFNPSLLSHETEKELTGLLADFPRVVGHAAELREPHRIARFIEVIAGAYHRWYDNCRIIPPQDEPITILHSTRLALNVATGIVIKNGLDLLGVNAPDRM